MLSDLDAQIPVKGQSNPVNYNDPALTARVRASIETAVGKDNVVEAARWMASEDFPQLAMSIKVPSVYFFVGSTPMGVDAATAPTNHSPKFFLDEGALKLAKAASGRYKAATEDGNPVASCFGFRIKFQLRN